MAIWNNEMTEYIKNWSSLHVTRI